MLNRKWVFSFLLLLLYVIALSGCSSQQQLAGESAAENVTPIPIKSDKEGPVFKAAPELSTGEVVVIETQFGSIVIAFYQEEAPLHTDNFRKLAREGFYDGCTFHRVIPNFVIQGGSSGSKDADRANDGLGGPGYTVPAELGVIHTRGAVAAARQGDEINPDKESNGSQFYICLRDIPHLDRGGYSVFGQVIEGMDVVDTIAGVETDDRDNPLQRVEMTVRIENRQ